jgi:hypothetical protein
MALYNVRPGAGIGTSPTRAVSRRSATVVVAALVVLVGIPLRISSITIAHDTSREIQVRDASQRWGDSVGWDVTNVTSREGVVVVEFQGMLPVPATASLSAALVATGVDPRTVRAEFVPRETVDLGQPGR